MKIAITTALLFMFLIGCRYAEYTESEILHEKGVVLQKLYSPSKHENNVTLPLIKFGEGSSGFGIGMDGNLGFHTGGLMFTQNTVKEKYGIVFRCQHGSFAVEDFPQGFAKLNEGDSVTISYKELYGEERDSEFFGSMDTLISRTLYKYDFIDANAFKY